MDELMTPDDDVFYGPRKFEQDDYNREVMRAVVYAVGDHTDQFAGVRSWSDVYGRCDGNDFAIAADHLFADSPSGVDNDWRHVNIAYKFVADVFRWTTDD